MRWQFTVITVTALALIAASCARVKPRPQSDFYAYNENLAATEAANIIRLTRAVRRHNGLLEARGRLVNCTNHTLQIEARATFHDAGDRKPRLRPPGKISTFRAMPCNRSPWSASINARRVICWRSGKAGERSAIGFRLSSAGGFA